MTVVYSIAFIVASVYSIGKYNESSFRFVNVTEFVEVFTCSLQYYLFGSDISESAKIVFIDEGHEGWNFASVQALNCPITG